MTRGRRPDAGLEPSRQLLTQRAFRQRRAAYLADLEEKITKLERENAALKGIEYVESVEREEKGSSTKRFKSEVSEESVWPDAHDGINETSSSSCEMCAIHEKEKQDLIKAVAVVDSALFSLSEAMHSLRQSVSTSPQRKAQSIPPSTTQANHTRQPNTIKHQHSYSNISTEGSNAFASSSSDMLNVPLPTPNRSNSHLKRSSIDEVESSITSPVQIQRERTSSAVAAAAASARSAGSANATCTPSSGDCCSKQSNPAIEIRPADRSSHQPPPPQHQHQHQHHLHSQHITPNSRHRIASSATSAKTDAALGLAQLGIDEAKCCLGLFECDANGNFLAN
jgi:hypothetical protein